MVSTASECRSGSPVQPGIEGTRKSTTAATTRPSWRTTELRSSLPSPPTSIATPSTSRMFETMLPASDPRTTPGSESAIASSAMISSGALPKLAFRKPPIPGPVCSAAWSVASPISQARGISASAASANSVTWPGSARRSTRNVMGARASDAHRIFRATARTLPAVLRAVLFDWGDTLMEWTWAPDLLEAGHRAGLAAIGRDGLPDADDVTARFRDAYEPLLSAPGVVEELEYPGLVRSLLADVGVEIDDAELDRFLRAEHAAWEPSRRLGGTTHALLESLRGRGLKLGLVSNAFDSPNLQHADLEQLGIAERIDFAVFSSEVGTRKPHPAIFERALDALGVEPGEALFVGDRLFEDVKGASDVGMTTVQALWFRADAHPDGVEPDFEAFTQMDVLNVVRRLSDGD